MQYSTWLVYCVEVYCATSLRKKISSTNYLFQCQDRKNNSADIFRECKKKKQMHSMELVVAYSAQIFSFCSLTDSLETGVVNHKEHPFYLLLPTSPPLHPDMHLYLHTCHLNVSTQAWDRAPSLSDLYFWKGLSLLSFRIFSILTLFSTEIFSLGLKILVYAEQKTPEFLEQNLALSYTCHMSAQSELVSLPF